jgi:large subunit ribosomal protein L34e
VRVSKTPGNRLRVLSIKKKTSQPKCKISNTVLKGIKREKANSFMNSCKRKKSISRPYGGVISGSIVEKRIKKAFLIEEQKIVKTILKGNN